MNLLWLHVEGAAVVGDETHNERDRLHSVDFKDGGKGLELYEVS